MILYIFPTPPDASCTLKTDRGDVIHGHQATHPSGRQGVGFDIPAGHPNGNGANLVIGAAGFVPLDLRAILWLPSSGAYLQADDFHLQRAGSSLPPLRIQGTGFVQEV